MKDKQNFYVEDYHLRQPQAKYNRHNSRYDRLYRKNSDVLEEHEIEYLTEFPPSTSNFYVLPKVHKSKIITNLVEEKSVEYLKIENPPEIPSRPVVAGPNSPTHRLSIF